MTYNFKRVAIVNRGVAAMRFIRAARELNQEHGTSLRTIALYTEPDRHSAFVREADEAFLLGPATYLDPTTGQHHNSYTDYARLENALSVSRADAVWAGWGFVAGHAEFADLCRDLGVLFIGPNGDIMRRLGDNIAAKQLAEKAGVPVAPWSGGAVETLEDAIRQAERLSYPILLKATAGHGSRGMIRVDSAIQLTQAFEKARYAAFRAFGNPTIYMEEMLQGARHVEVEVVGDLHGTTWALGVRDCTIQRCHQKVLDEAPSPVLSFEDDRSLRDAAVCLSHAAGYYSAGTVEFLYQPRCHRFSFLKMNTQLPVEHAVTECTTGIDIVKLQILIARGEPLGGIPHSPRGHAVGVRLNAEDAEYGFAPARGVVERICIASGPGLRIDTGVAEGNSLAPELDRAIAYITAYGRSRDEAIARLRRVLSDSIVVLKGGTTNKGFLLELLNHPEIRNATADTEWLDQLVQSGEHVSRQYADVALVAAAIEVYDSELKGEQTEFYASAARGRPQARTELGRTVALRYLGNVYTAKVCRLGASQYRVDTHGAHVDVAFERVGQNEYRLNAFNRWFRVVSSKQELQYRMEVDGTLHRIDCDDGGLVRAMSPAVVVSVGVEPGDKVRAGDPVAVLEAMKMEMAVTAPFSGKVRRVFCMPNVQVDPGAPLLQIDPVVEKEVPISSDLVQIGASCTEAFSDAPVSRCRQTLRDLRQMMLGFDIDAKPTTHLLSEWIRTCPAENDDIRHSEDEILNIFADVCSLFRNDPSVDDHLGGEAPSAETYLFSYLRMLDSRGEGLPPEFIDALLRTLAHYDVATLERSSELEETLLWIYKAHQRVALFVPPILDILERRLRSAESLRHSVDGEFRILLDRVVWITRNSFPAVSDLAREVCYRYFDQIQFDQSRKQVYARVQDHLSYLTANPEASERREQIRALVECPQPLVSLFAGKFASASRDLRSLMLEVLTWRHYRIRMLMNFRCLESNGLCYASAEYDHESKRIHVFTTYAEYDRIPDAARALSPLIGEVPPDHDIVIDFYVWHSSVLKEADATQQEVRSMLQQTTFSRPIRRIVVAIGSPGRWQGMGGMQHFTYRPSKEGYEEEKLYRGLHPMMGKRLHLWRLTNFNIERLPSVEDVYLLRGIARNNPKDERLFACAEVRDLTPIRDGTGRIVQLPQLERQFAEAMAAIRMVQSRRKPHERLYWNRIFLYVWPPFKLDPDEFKDIVHRLAPATEGLGLEQVAIRARIPSPETGELRDMVVRISSPCGSGLLITFRPSGPLQPLKPLSPYEQKVVRMRQRGLIYPYEIIRMLTPGRENTQADFPSGDFVEHDLDSHGFLVPVDRPHGENKANVIVGIIRNFTPNYPEGMARVLLMGDPCKDLGAIAEPECRRIIAALDKAQDMGVPLEWFPISAGAKISMESGVENMDWIARVLRRLIEFTQAGGEVNLVVNGINVGAQPYWNAEATMLMHTRGILIMTPKAAMVLTGKRALDYSGSVSADDNFGIGGYDRIMGLNGQAQYWARDIDEACHILLRHYEHTYVAPGERFPRRVSTNDAIERNICVYPHDTNHQGGFAHVGDIFSNEANRTRKKAFDIRRVMMAAVDQDHPPLERWAGMRAAETAVVWDAHLGGFPVCLIGIESRPIPRLGFVPADGPNQFTAGTLFPLSSKKVARAINAASNNRPVVVLANLSGFDGSPESMRRLQLEYGAEIGRAVVNFKGPMIFCVISRYHGGAYVVFSRALNENLEVLALEGTYASVIGGAPAAAVVFANDVEARARKDPRLQTLTEAIERANNIEKSRLRAQWDELFKIVHSEKLGEVAEEFDRIHSVHRALKMGALNEIIPPVQLRPHLIHALERATGSVAEAELTQVGDKKPEICAA